MKILLASIVSICLVAPALAQFSKGTWMVGGGISGQSITDKVKFGSGPENTEEVRHVLTLTPTVGYFIADRFAVGAGFSVQRYSLKSSDSSKSVSYNFKLSPFARYYIDQLFIQATLALGAGTDKNTTSQQTSKSTNSSFGANVGIGYAIMLNSTVAIEPQLGFGYTSYRFGDASYHLNDYSIYLQLAIQLYLHRQS